MTKNPNTQKSKTPNNIKTKNNKEYNLEKRLENFFVSVIKLCKKYPPSTITTRIISQLIASSGSVSANYAEASEAMSKKDFVKSIKICRKESKESRVWLKGLKTAVNDNNPEFDFLVQESTEFIYIFTSILKKTDVK